jgi:hypothetical protein
MIGFIGTSLQLHSITAAHTLNSFWTTSVWQMLPEESHTAVWISGWSLLLLNQSQSCIATDRRSISKSWCRAPTGAHDQIFIIVWPLQSCFCGAPSLTRGRVCLLYMLLVLASAVFLGSESLGSHMSQYIPTATQTHHHHHHHSYTLIRPYKNWRGKEERSILKIVFYNRIVRGCGWRVGYAWSNRGNICHIKGNAGDVESKYLAVTVAWLRAMMGSVVVLSFLWGWNVLIMVLSSSVFRLC